MDLSQCTGTQPCQLRNMLNVTDFEAPGYPSEIFRILQKNGLKNCAAYRYQWLHLGTWKNWKRDDFTDG